MKVQKLLITMLMVLGFSMFLQSCNDGPMEEAGESIDNALDDAGDSLNDAGNAIEDACEDITDENC